MFLKNIFIHFYIYDKFYHVFLFNMKKNINYYIKFELELQLSVSKSLFLFSYIVLPYLSLTGWQK